MFESFVLKVLISTPGDTGDEVAVIMESLHGWNGSRAEVAGVILLPRHWKADAVPRLGAGSGQGVINERLVDDADIVIAVFDSRLGQATTAAVSGTAEEIQRAINSGKHVHVWFSTEPLRHDVDIQQLDALRKFQAHLATQGLLGDYGNLPDLGYKVRAAIEEDLAEMGLDAPAVRRRIAEHAMPRARRDGEFLVVENKSASVTAEHFRFSIEGVWPSAYGDLGTSGSEPVFLGYEDEPINLLPLSEMRWAMTVFMQSPPQLRVTMRWVEGEAACETNQVIAL